eukprot:8067355-Ditylum_brightwellii.AAC.1
MPVHGKVRLDSDGIMAVGQFKDLPKSNAPSVHQKFPGQSILYVGELLSTRVVPDYVSHYRLLGFTPEKKEGGVDGVKGHGSEWRGDPIPKLMKNLHSTFLSVGEKEVIGMPVKKLGHFHCQKNVNIRMHHHQNQGDSGGCGIIQGIVVGQTWMHYRTRPYHWR